jgi:creatinine deaminase|tara:strand:- start:1192 stop:1650 length:459 start_codon:yes stop_codon:yes gene_type:complete
MNNIHIDYMNEAIIEAKIGLDEGGIPIGSVIVYKDKIIGRGHNQRVQNSNPLMHGEMDAFQNAGRLDTLVYKECTIYSTLSPCIMCSGTIVHYKIPLLVIGENETVKDTTFCEDFLIENKTKIINLDLNECKSMMNSFIENNEKLWFEDISI